jgi:uncharacterized protein YecE (DUF72 family)
VPIEPDLAMGDLNWHIGTMGYGYKDWQGPFYPAGLNQREFLSHYAEFFNSVEMDSTFYGTPRPEYVKRWAQTTPPSFIFCPKLPRLITHELRLSGAGAETEEFLETVRLLGGKLGPVLIQFPPDYSREEIDTLGQYLSALPTDLRYAVEFRHRSWHATVTGELLQEHRVAWVSTDYLYMPKRVYVTTDFLYLRFLGRHGTYMVKDHERVDKTERLQEWVDDVRSRQIEGFQDVYAYVNDDYAGFAPATAQKLKRRAGLPTDPLTPPEQPRLL